MKIAITGAANGIGAALARRIISTGGTVIGIDRDTDSLMQLQAEVGESLVSVEADLACDEDIGRIVAQLQAGPRLDGFIHNAGINHVERFERSPWPVQRSVLDINLRAPLRLTAGLLDGQVLSSGSSLVFISSLSVFISYPGAAVYAASKGGLASYARSLGVALAPRGIHVLTVYPGPTRTGHARLHSPDNRREHRRMHPDALAERILKAMRRRKSRLIPGVQNRLSCWLGIYASRLAEKAMKRVILDRLRPDA